MNQYMDQYRRRDVLKAGLVANAAPAILQSQVRRNSRPNILFLMDDQHRGDCTSADGNRAIKTPNIDRIGLEGARFRNAYTTTPTCTPGS